MRVYLLYQTSIVGNFYFRKESISNRFCVKTQFSWTILDFLQVVLLSIGFLVLHAFRLQQFSLQQLRESFLWLYQNKWKVFMTFNEFTHLFHEFFSVWKHTSNWSTTGFFPRLASWKRNDNRYRISANSFHPWIVSSLE